MRFMGSITLMITLLFFCKTLMTKEKKIDLLHLIPMFLNVIYEQLRKVNIIKHNEICEI
jgi:hypothetical protein